MQHPKREKSVDYLLRTVGLGLRDLTDEKISSFGLSGPQGRILGAIYYGTQNGMEVSRKDLQQQMQIRGPSVTSLLNGLEKKGLIHRKAASDDARLITLKVTAKGEKVIEETAWIFKAVQNQLMLGFSKTETDLLIAFLSRMKENLKR